jgi:predicted enzyme related to lactoylglutathione lyase
MPEVTEYQPGTPSWVDLVSPNVDASVDFYRDLFGWDFASAGPVEQTGGYGMFTLRDKNVAGIGPQMDPSQPPRWSTYVSVTDVEATAARVEAHNGTVVMPPMQVMTAGTMGVFVDSSGAPISAWQPAEHIGAQIVNEPGAFCWCELRSTHPGGSIAFYEHVFDWTSDVTDMDGSPYTLFLLGDRPIAGMSEESADGQSRWEVSFAVADCDATVAKCQELGGGVEMGPVDSSVGRFAMLRDPHGSVFGVIKLAES